MLEISLQRLGTLSLMYCYENDFTNKTHVMSRGWLSVKFAGKTNRLKEMLIFTIWPISCISLVFLIEICSFCKFIIRFTFCITKLIRSTSESSSCTDIYSTVTQDPQFSTSVWCNNVPIERTTPIEHALALTMVCYVSDLHRCSSVSNAWMHTPIYGSPFNLSSVDLWIFPIDSYA